MRLSRRKAGKAELALHRTQDPIRLLDAEALGIGSEEAVGEHDPDRPDDPPLSSEDTRLAESRRLPADRPGETDSQRASRHR